MYTDTDIATLTSLKRKTNSYCVIKDHVFDDVIEDLYADVQILKEKLRPAKMSKSRGTKEEWEDGTHRGDSICWVTPQLCKELQLLSLQTYIQRMLNECGILQTHLGLSPEYTCQFAVYPGKGEGYNRHKDAFSVPPVSSTCTKTDDDDTDTTEQSQSQPQPQSQSRQLTCLLYLNKDWVPANGGQLRVFTHPGVHVEKGDEPFNFWGVNGYDINPVFGRLVIFRSELVEHAVLPCFQERMALTFWVNGTGPLEKVIESSESVFKFDADAPTPEIKQEGSESDSESDSDSEDDSATIEVLHAVNDAVEVKLNGLWVEGIVTAISPETSRYSVTTVTGIALTNKGRYEVRPPAPKHTGSLLSKTNTEHDWVAFKQRWRDMSEEERGAQSSVLFGDNTWTCCSGAWNSLPCSGQ